MTKRILTILLILLTMSMVGCSDNSKLDISSDGTNILIKGKPVALTDFDGSTGHYIVGDITVNYTPCVELRDCPRNRQGVYEQDCDKIGDVIYFTAFNDTYRVMHTPSVEGVTKEAEITTANPDATTLDSVKKDVADTLGKIKFEQVTSTVFADSVQVTATAGKTIIVRAENITIPDTLVVFKGTRDDGTQQVDINGITVSKYSSTDYDFYSYKDCTIKCSNKVNPAEFIKLI